MRMPMMAITTSSSTRVNPRFDERVDIIHLQEKKDETDAATMPLPSAVILRENVAENSAGLRTDENRRAASLSLNAECVKHFCDKGFRATTARLFVFVRPASPGKAEQDFAE